MAVVDICLPLMIICTEGRREKQSDKERKEWKTSLSLENDVDAVKPSNHGLISINNSITQNTTSVS